MVDVILQAQEVDFKWSQSLAFLTLPNTSDRSMSSLHEEQLHIRDLKKNWNISWQ